MKKATHTMAELIDLATAELRYREAARAAQRGLARLNRKVWYHRRKVEDMEEFLRRTGTFEDYLEWVLDRAHGHNR